MENFTRMFIILHIIWNAIYVCVIVSNFSNLYYNYFTDKRIMNVTSNDLPTWYPSYKFFSIGSLNLFNDVSRIEV